MYTLFLYLLTENRLNNNFFIDALIWKKVEIKSVKYLSITVSFKKNL